MTEQAKPKIIPEERNHLIEHERAVMKDALFDIRKGMIKMENGLQYVTQGVNRLVELLAKKETP